jgi:Amt family ammonium transporter
MIIGTIAGILCQEVVNFIRNILKIDDTLDVFAVHGVGGIFGALMIPAFDSFGFENGSSWVSQIGSVFFVGAFTIIMSTIILKIVQLLCPLRVAKEIEDEGLDLAVHGERAYDISS